MLTRVCIPFLLGCDVKERSGNSALFFDSLHGVMFKDSIVFTICGCSIT